MEEVTLIDKFTNPENGKTSNYSNCFRITYRSMERSLTDEEINALQVGGYWRLVAVGWRLLGCFSSLRVGGQGDRRRVDWL